MDGGAWWAAVHGVARSQTRLSNFTFTFHFYALKKEMAIHSSTLAWKIPWTEEPDTIFEGFPGGSEVKASASNVGNPGSFPVSGRSPGEGNGNPVHYSCLENSMDRGAW